MSFTDIPETNDRRGRVTLSHNELGWLPEDGVALSRAQLASIMESLHGIRWATPDDDVVRVHLLNVIATLNEAAKGDGR